MDASAQYGNESLVYAIRACEPDLYKMYILDLSATSSDSDSSATSSVSERSSSSVVYSIDGANPYYQLDAQSCEIRTTALPVDFEEKDNLKLNAMRSIQIRASSLDAYFSYMTHVSVNIVDVNDHAPQIVLPSGLDETFASVLENQTSVVSAVVVGRVHAVDMDTDDYGLVQSKLVNHNNEPYLFQVDAQSGLVTLIRPDLIDRETNDTLRLDIFAYDNPNHENIVDNASHKTSTSLTIQVLDINVNWPIFPRFIHSTLPIS